MTLSDILNLKKIRILAILIWRVVREIIVNFTIFHLLSGSLSNILLVPGNVGGLMKKVSLRNKPLLILLFLSTFGTSLNINLPQGIDQKAIAYEAHEMVFVYGLNNFASMSQQQADEVCKNNFSDLRQQGIFDENVERNTWHIWAHLNNKHCVINLRNWSGRSRLSYWVPSNNRDKRFRIRIPIFSN